MADNDVRRAARELVAAYGAGAIRLMRERSAKVSQRGDEKTAVLWLSIAAAAEQQIDATQARSELRDLE